MINVSQSWAGHPGRLVANTSTYFDAECKHDATGSREDACRLPPWQVWAKPQGKGAQAVPRCLWSTTTEHIHTAFLAEQYKLDDHRIAHTPFAIQQIFCPTRSYSRASRYGAHR